MVKFFAMIAAAFLAVLLFFVSAMGAIYTGIHKPAGVDADSVTEDMMLDEDSISPEVMGYAMEFIVTCYFPGDTVMYPNGHPSDPMGGNASCADGTLFTRDPNGPPVSNLTAKTPDGRVITGVCAIVQDQHSPQVSWSVKDSVTLAVPAYNDSAEIHARFAACVTDPRRLDLAMSGPEQQADFFRRLPVECPEAKPYTDPGGSNYNNGTLMTICVLYPEGELLMGDDGHYFPFQRRGAYHYSDDFGYANGLPKGHQGNDLFAAKGEPVVAVYDGFVEHATTRWDSLNCRLFTNDQYNAQYSNIHLDGYATPTHVYVKGGQVIGFNGDSGDAKGTEPHVHFEMHPNRGSAVNPHPYLKKWENGRGDPKERMRKFMDSMRFNSSLAASLMSCNIETASRYGMDWRFALVTAVAESSGGRNLFHPFNPYGYGSATFSSWEEATDRYYATIAGYGFGNNYYRVFLTYRGANNGYAENCTAQLQAI